MILRASLSCCVLAAAALKKIEAEAAKSAIVAHDAVDAAARKADTTVSATSDAAAAAETKSSAPSTPVDSPTAEATAQQKASFDCGCVVL